MDDISEKEELVVSYVDGELDSETAKYIIEEIEKNAELREFYGQVLSTTALSEFSEKSFDIDDSWDKISKRIKNESQFNLVNQEEDNVIKVNFFKRNIKQISSLAATLFVGASLGSVGSQYAFYDTDSNIGEERLAFLSPQKSINTPRVRGEVSVPRLQMKEVVIPLLSEIRRLHSLIKNKGLQENLAKSYPRADVIYRSVFQRIGPVFGERSMDDLENILDDMENILLELKKSADLGHPLANLILAEYLISRDPKSAPFYYRRGANGLSKLIE